MNFLDFRQYAFIISKKNRLPLFELIKDEAAFEGMIFSCNQDSIQNQKMV